MLNNIIKEQIIDIPWPIVIDNKWYDGNKFKIPPKCTNECIDNKNDLKTITCEHGLSHMTREILGQKVTISGVYLQSGSSSKRYKKNTTYMERKVSVERIELWFLNLNTKATLLQSIVTKAAKKEFDQFHEFVKWSGEIKKYSEILLDKSTTAGKTSEELKSLYKTSVMLMDSLETTAIYFNPQSAKIGRKKTTDIYRMIDKIKFILSAPSKKGRVDIKITGCVKKDYKVYESFKIIPLSLIQNAIKYKHSGNVDIIFDETDERLKISVVSTGDEISSHEIDQLFIRGYRTEKARSMPVEGSGLGLYVLKVVADAHRFNVNVTSIPQPPYNRKLAKNTFTIIMN